MFGQGTQHSRPMLVRALSQKLEMTPWAGDQATLTKFLGELSPLLEAYQYEIAQACKFAPEGAREDDAHA